MRRCALLARALRDIAKVSGLGSRLAQENRYSLSNIVVIPWKVQLFGAVEACECHGYLHPVAPARQARPSFVQIRVGRPVRDDVRLELFSGNLPAPLEGGSQKLPGPAERKEEDLAPGGTVARPSGSKACS